MNLAFAYFLLLCSKYRRWLQMGELDVEIAMQVEDEMGKVVLPVCWSASSRLALLVLACIVMLGLDGLAAAIITELTTPKTSSQKA
jgi:hypothetical protein